MACVFCAISWCLLFSPSLWGAWSQLRVFLFEIFFNFSNSLSCISWYCFVRIVYLDVNDVLCWFCSVWVQGSRLCVVVLLASSCPPAGSGGALNLLQLTLQVDTLIGLSASVGELSCFHGLHTALLEGRTCRIGLELSVCQEGWMSASPAVQEDFWTDLLIKTLVLGTVFCLLSVQEKTYS